MPLRASITSNIKFLGLFLMLSVAASPSKLTAQATVLPANTLKALNNYMHYSNEVAHACNLMFPDFNDLNNQFYNYAIDSIQNINYTARLILTNEALFKTIPRDLYAQILEDNVHLPYQKRGAPLQLVGKIKNVLREIETSRQSLKQYIQSGAFKEDKHLEQGFQKLRRIEVLYYDIFTLQEKLHWNLQSIMSTYSLPANNYLSLTDKLQGIIGKTKLMVKSVRANDNSNLLRSHCFELKMQLNDFSKAQATTILDASIRKKIDNILKNASICLEIGQRFLSGTASPKRAHEEHYYAFNEQILPQYSLESKGLVVLFNQLTDTWQVSWLKEQEMPPIFEVLYPDFPEFEAFQAADIDVDELIQKAMKAKAQKDSLQQAEQAKKQKQIADSLALAQQIVDSIEYRKLHPQRGDLNLTGFASNNLVFLLDISSSMSDSNKLPLLKVALKQLLDLMRPEDNITFITYSGTAKIVLEPTSAQYKKRILNAIDNLVSGGMSDADEGIQLAYQTIQKNIIEAGNNRIIMATDGAIKVKNSTIKRIKKGSKDKDAVRLSVFYFSDKEYSHHTELLKALSENGGGKYSYIQKENAQQILLMEAQVVRSKDR